MGDRQPRVLTSSSRGWRTDNGTGGEVTVPGAFNQGLQVEVYRDKVVVRARDFGRSAWIKQITVPLHAAL
ncbi:DUF4073 domain-containing protein [Streptomyces sp. LHD-70]|uniref:DUF4073 domain-containing protein n=1 Tax=Streptomyces sp. LHD-70 TaxID=3072140 RepID=UPI00280F7293|nr:DUF4073 domain-containing protein [Streptomyces sp. LHD-70]MDQ8701332.1 DUF4073 domain-containing protein [Streptomyces sp. LHD-70]